MNPVALLLAAFAAQLLGGGAALVTGRRGRWPGALGAAGAVAGACLGLPAALGALLGGEPALWRAPWPVPGGALSLGLDPLSAVFLLPVLVVPALAAVYGAGYLGGGGGGKQGPHWFFYTLLCVSMGAVVMARNGLLFLVAWEVMSLASYFLVVYEDDREEVREAGWVYLAATHLGTAFLIGFFALAARASGSLEFDGFGALAAAGPKVAGGAFLLALVGFGTKAGLVPFHIWLPRAHPAAPTHVSAVLSAVMLKMGLYGLFRALALLGPAPAWWGWVLGGLGLASALLGVLYALAQGDLKKTLAYSSVENVGLVALAAGLGVVGLAGGFAPLAALAFTAALLHALNHALFKGLLFMGAGAVGHGAGTRQMDRLGGLLRRMPWTGALVLVGAAAAAALPPLNGFSGEFLLVLGAFQAAASGTAAVALPALVALAGVALVSGLAAACYLGAAGISLLGEPRSEAAARAREVGPLMRGPMAAAAGLCALAGLGSPWIAQALAPAVAQLCAPLPARAVEVVPGRLLPAVAAGALFVLFALALALLRGVLLSGRPVTAAPTWGCGYVAPAPSMQYTSAGFAQPLLALFAPLTGWARRGEDPEGLFPGAGRSEASAPDRLEGRLYLPLFRRLGEAARSLRWLQEGRVQVYVLYIALALVALLVWKVR